MCPDLQWSRAKIRPYRISNPQWYTSSYVRLYEDGIDLEDMLEQSDCEDDTAWQLPPLTSDGPDGHTPLVNPLLYDKGGAMLHVQPSNERQ